jgi:hypothetical protein
MATLNIINNFDMTAQGVTVSGKQGAVADSSADPLAVTVSGLDKSMTGQLATATVATLFDSSVDLPATFAYLFFWADQITYLQIVGSGSNVIHKVAATQPFVLPGYNKILAAASTSLITGGSEPVVTTIAKVAAGNYTGVTANYVFRVIL